jgi:hypothetical protein
VIPLTEEDERIILEEFEANVGSEEQTMDNVQSAFRLGFIAALNRIEKTEEGQLPW